MDTILEDVRASLSADPIPQSTPKAVNGDASEYVFQAQENWDHDMDAEYEEAEFDDTGEGAGVEGDLDIDDE